MRAGMLAFLLLGLGACGSSTAPAGDLQVLFIGSSFTSTHDIPALVERIARYGGGPLVTSSAVAFDGFSLEDHWSQGDALEAIDRGGWDVVAMQQGPSAAPEHRAHLLEWAGRFAGRIRGTGGVPALYMVWPGNGEWDPVIESYTAAAESIDGELLPAGRAFRAVVEGHPDIDLFESDGLHPSLTGAYLAALTIYGALAGRSVVGATSSLLEDGISPAITGILAAAADRANGR